MLIWRACPLLAVLGAACVAPRATHADPVTVRAEAQTLSVDCAGGDAEVSGNRNTVTFAGACRGLTLRGDANRIAIGLASGARLDIEGNGNTIRYSIEGGGREPAVRVSGSDTDLSSTGLTPAPAIPGGPVRLTGDNQHLDLDCGLRDVDIQGNRSRYTLRGGCASLSVHGEANEVRAALQPGARVEIEGNGTELRYSIVGTGPDAAVVVRGENSHATRLGGDDGATAMASPPPSAPPPAPASPAPAGPPPASLGPVAGVPRLMHDLNGKVVAEGTLVALPADKLFDGSGTLRDGSAAELADLASLIAQIHASGVRITGVDPADAVLARRQATSLRDWLAQHVGAGLSVRIDGVRGSPPHVDVLMLRQ